MNDFARAIVVLSEILEEYPNTPSYPDALWLRGRDVLRRARLPRGAPRLPGARRSRQRAALPGLLRQGAGSPGRRRASASNDPPESLAAIFEKLEPGAPGAGRRRAALRQGQGVLPPGGLERRERGVRPGRERNAVHPPGPVLPGLVALKAARADGRDPTRRARSRTTSPRSRPSAPSPSCRPTRPEHQHVIDLGVDGHRPPLLRDGAVPAGERGLREGRPGQPRVRHDALRARVGVRAARRRPARRSRARGAMASDPNSSYIGDGTLLRADLLLRAGAFDRALELYQSVLAQYEPMRAKVQSFLDSTKDVSVYYDKLAQQQLDLLDQNDALPVPRDPLGARGRGRAAGVRRDRRRQRVQDAHQQSNQLIDKLTALVGASNRVRAFPELEAGEEAAPVARQPRLPRAAHHREGARPRGAGRPGRRDRSGPPAATGPHGGHRRAPGRRRGLRTPRAAGPGAVEPAVASSSRGARWRSTRCRRASTACGAC